MVASHRPGGWVLQSTSKYNTVIVLRAHYKVRCEDSLSLSLRFSSMINGDARFHFDTTSLYACKGYDNRGTNLYCRIELLIPLDVQNVQNSPISFCVGYFSLNSSRNVLECFEDCSSLVVFLVKDLVRVFVTTHTQFEFANAPISFWMIILLILSLNDLNDQIDFWMKWWWAWH